MDNRRYNIFFHTHTISGIFICALLYVIFFAGSFSFFKDDITAWQRNSSYTANRETKVKDFNKVLDSLSVSHYLKGRDFDFGMQRNNMGAYVSMSASHDSTVKPKPKPKGAEVKKARRGRGGNGDNAFFTYDFINEKPIDYQSGYDMGEFLYRLHFLAQLNVVPLRLGSPFGYLLAGVVAFLFLFALITGLMVHWNKIKSNFFIFRPWNKWKTVFTDMHTALGVIQFPFQFVFAVTGIVLIVNSVLIVPYSKYLYNNDSEKLYETLGYSDTSKFEYSYKPLTASFDLNNFIADVDKKYDHDVVDGVTIKNYLDDNMHVIVDLKPKADASFTAHGKVIYRVRDQKMVHEASPLTNSSYVDKVKGLIYHLHFGDYGGKPLRVMYFLLGVMGCIVIISGIMIWLVARDKASTPNYKRVFNFWTANVFLGACMPLLPVTAVTMTAILFMKQPGQTEIYHWYFYSWLALGVYFIIRRKIAVTMHQSTVLSAITCLALPLADGIQRGNWFWKTYSDGAYDILFIDLLFLSLSIISVAVLYKMKQKAPENKAVGAKTRPAKENTVLPAANVLQSGSAE